jgi:hypothetical protein
MAVKSGWHMSGLTLEKKKIIVTAMEAAQA